MTALARDSRPEEQVRSRYRKMFTYLTPQQVAGSVFAAELGADRDLNEDEPEAP